MRQPGGTGVRQPFAALDDLRCRMRDSSRQSSRPLSFRRTGSHSGLVEIATPLIDDAARRTLAPFLDPRHVGPFDARILVDEDLAQLATASPRHEHQLASLDHEVLELRSQVEDLSHRLGEAEERLDFSERLLAQRPGVEGNR